MGAGGSLDHPPCAGRLLRSPESNSYNTTAKLNDIIVDELANVRVYVQTSLDKTNDLPGRRPKDFDRKVKAVS